MKPEPVTSRFHTRGLLRSLTAAAVVSGPALMTANARIIYSGPQNRTTTAAPGVSDVEAINVDGVGAAEFQLVSFSSKGASVHWLNGGPGNPPTAFTGIDSNGLAAGAGNIGAGSSFSTSTISSVPRVWAAGREAFVGFRFNPTGSQFVYGWGRLRVSTGPDSMTLMDWAYEDTGASIVPGALSHPLVLELPGGVAVGIGGAPVAFGGVLAGGSARQTFKLRNDSYTPVSGLTAGLSGANATEFVIESGSLPAVLGAGASVELTVSFTPGAAGVRAATLTIASNAAGSPQLFALQGTEAGAPGQAVSLGAGHGADGPLTVSTKTETCTLRAALPATTYAGANSLTVSSSSGFQAGQTVVVLQMTGVKAGLYEEAVLASAAGGTLGLQQPLRNTFPVSPLDAAQVLAVPQFSDLTILPGGTLTCPAWDGNTGGVLWMKVAGEMRIEGAIDVSGMGFAGGAASNGGVGGVDGNPWAPAPPATPGSSSGISPQIVAPLMLGGSGGSAGRGGDGGKGGSPGGPGGSGGKGGKGGNGGGIVHIDAQMFTGTGTINANGTSGAGGTSGLAGTDGAPGGRGANAYTWWSPWNPVEGAVPHFVGATDGAPGGNGGAGGGGGAGGSGGDGGSIDLRVNNSQFAGSTVAAGGNGAAGVPGGAGGSGAQGGVGGSPDGMAGPSGHTGSDGSHGADGIEGRIGAVKLMIAPRIYSFWQARNFSALELSDPAVSGANADADHDGVPNLLEFAFNLNPRAADSTSLSASDGAAGLPVSGLQTPPAGPMLTIAFLRRKATSQPGISYHAQFAATPGNAGWDPSINEVVTSIDDIWESVVATDPAPAGALRRFGRVQVFVAP